MPSTSMATFGTRLYTVISATWVKAKLNKADTSGNQGTRDMCRSIVQRTPTQASDLEQFIDENANLLAGIDCNGNFYQGGVPTVKYCVTQTTLSAAQITTLHTVPVPLIAAPGAGVALLVDALIFQFKYGTVQFTGGGAVSPVYHGQSTNHLGGSVAAATITAAANATISLGPLATNFTMLSNTGVDLLAATANFAAGDSTAIVTTFYTQYTLG